MFICTTLGSLKVISHLYFEKEKIFRQNITPNLYGYICILSYYIRF